MSHVDTPPSPSKLGELLTPRIEHGRYIAWVIAGLVALAGLLSLFTPLSHLFHALPPAVLRNFGPPLEPIGATRAIGAVVGLALLYMSYQLLERRQTAWRLTLVLLVVAGVVHVIDFRHVALGLPYIVLAGVLLAARHYFLARSQPGGWARAGVALATSILVALAYGTIGFWLTDKRDFGQSFTVVGAIIQTLRSYFLLGDPTLHSMTRLADLFLDRINALGMFALLFGFVGLFRPLRYRLQTLPSERQQVARLIEQWGTSAEDPFKLWPEDKSYFLPSEYEAGIAYGVRGGIALTVGDPVGRPEDLAPTILAFTTFCLTRGWIPVGMYAGAELTAAYQAADLNPLKIGEDAEINVERFITETARNKHFRNINNRFGRLGYRFAFCEPPHDDVLLQELAKISVAWLAQPGRQDLSFIAGHFDRNYLGRCGIGVVYNEQNEAVAFTNELPRVRQAPVTVDLMRYNPDGPPNVMDFLFMSYLRVLHERGVDRFSLGLAPLAGLDDPKGKPEERLLNLIYHSRQPFVAVRGLRQFKTKFDPQWQSRYLYIPTGPNRLPRIAVALARLIRSDT